MKLGLLTDINMLLMVEKCIRGGICHAIYQYAKANNKYMKDYWDIHNLYVWGNVIKVACKLF